MISFTRLILRFASPLPKPEAFERYLFIGPHPDDIEIGAGAAAAKLAAAGKKVCFLICTDGRYGTENLDEGLTPEALAARREEEARAGAALLGVDDVRFLRLSDGGFYRREELLQGIARTVSDFQPDLVFAPDPAPANEAHPDHLNTGRAAAEISVFSYNGGIMGRYGAGPASVKAIAYYFTAHPTAFIGTTGLLKKQMRAIAAHASQFPSGSRAMRETETYLRLRAFEFGLRSHHGTAEGFRILGQNHLHVLAEKGQ